MGETEERRTRELTNIVALDYRTLIKHNQQLYEMADEKEKDLLFNTQEMLIALQEFTQKIMKRVAAPSTFKPLFCHSGKHMIVQEDGWYIMRTSVSGIKLITALSLDQIEQWLASKGDDWSLHLPLSSWEEGI